MTEQTARSAWPGALAAGTALMVGAWLLHDGDVLGLPPAPSAAEAFEAGAGSWPVVPPLPSSPPTRIRIPVLGLDAPVTRLGLDGEGRLQPPPDNDRNLAGWYRGGAAPGARGAAIVAGHVDTATGPAVFYRLGALRRGDQLEVAREDRATAYFQVDAVEVYPKKDFPDKKVYGATKDAQLRLITCGGGFSRGTGYDGNVVVFAHLVRTARA
ncbi:class F sortase [Kitasatospora cinereorecta]